MDTNRDSAHQSQNQDNFPTFSLGLEFLNEAEKEKNNGKGDSASRFASLSKGEMQQILQINFQIKPNKWQTGLFQPSKVSLNFSLTKLLNMYLQLFSEIVKLKEKLSAKFKKNSYINILFLHKCKQMLE